MTKKILLKWLEARKAEALAQVDTQETAAKAALLAEKLERTKFAEMVAYVEPRLTEVYDYMMDWHKKNEELAGPLSMSWGSVDKADLALCAQRQFLELFNSSVLGSRHIACPP